MVAHVSDILQIMDRDHQHTGKLPQHISSRSLWNSAGIRVLITVNPQARIVNPKSRFKSLCIVDSLASKGSSTLDVDDV